MTRQIYTTQASGLCPTFACLSMVLLGGPLYFGLKFKLGLALNATTFFLISFPLSLPLPDNFPNTITFPLCPALPDLPARCRKSIIFLGSSTINTCFTSGEKSNPLESKDVVTITNGGFFSSFLTTTPRCKFFIVPFFDAEEVFFRNPDKCRFEPIIRCLLSLVIGTQLTSCSPRYSLNSITFVLLLQKINTLDSSPFLSGDEAASSDQISRIRR